MSSPLPTGTVTFLFTDVEGSTRLLEELGADGYAVELGRHRDVVRSALAAHGGVEVDTQGDAFFCAFPAARSAVACAADVRDGLAGGPVRVRMGIHTGEALVVDRHYVGMDVHRAARIGACGHGGQIVLSPSTVALLEPGEFVVRELGPHRLKDLAAPVVLSQLGDEDHPPLKALFRTNLPIPATPFLGRDDELSALVATAREPNLRVLTLTGPGGTGKTRLSLQLAAELSDSYPDGAWWVPLASIREGELVPSALAGVLDVDEEPGRSLADSIAGALERRTTLLLVDNCEHLIDAAAALVSLIASRCPGVLAVATSREPLQISGEHVFAVPPLVEDDAIDLFHARARAGGAALRESGTDDVVRSLCARLDNLPLAVELAAARAASLPPAALLDRLATGLDVLKGPRDVDERQRTLRATIAWSHGLLTAAEQELFARLAVFVGGGSLAAIEDVCEASLEDLLSLVAKSLVRESHSDGADPRYWMLETIREFAVERLDAAGESDHLRDRHLEWFAGRLPEPGSDDLESIEGDSLTRLEVELANLRAAFAWATDPRRVQAPFVVRLGGALMHRHIVRGRYAEAEDVGTLGLAAGVEPVDAALFHDLLGVVRRLLGRPREALESYRAGERGLATVAERDAVWWDRWISLKLNQAHFFYFENDQESHGAVLDELEPAVDAHGTAAHRLDLMHARMQYRYRLERYALSAETEELARQVHELDVSRSMVAADFTLGFCLLWRGKLDEAEVLLDRGLAAARSAGTALFEARCLVYGLLVRRRLNDVERARARLQELASLDELHGYDGLIGACSAWVASRDGRSDLVVEHAARALREWGSQGRLGYGVFQWTARFPLLTVALADDDLDTAVEHARAMLDHRQHPLPEPISAALAAAVESRRAPDLRTALDLAKPGGYA